APRQRPGRVAPGLSAPTPLRVSVHPFSTRDSMSNRDIPVVILCGGKGTRFREQTELRPKPMIEVGPKPILLHIMSWYAAHGFKRFVLCLGYKADFIKRYFLD